MSKSTNDLKDGTRCMGCSDAPGEVRASAEAEAAVLHTGSKGKQQY